MKTILQKIVWAFMVLLLPLISLAAPDWQRTFTTTDPNYILQVVLLFENENATMVSPGDMVAFFDGEEITGVASVEDRNGMIVALPNVHTQAGKEYTVKIWKQEDDQIYVMSTTFETPADANGLSYYMTIGSLSLEGGCEISFSFESDEICAGETLSLSASPDGGTWSGDGVDGSSFTSSIAGEVTVSYSYTLDGCDLTKDTLITVKELPVVDVQDLEVCSNSPEILFENDTYDVSVEGSFVVDNVLNPAMVNEFGLANEHVMTVTDGECENKGTFDITVYSIGGAEVESDVVDASPSDGTVVLSAKPTANGSIVWIDSENNETSGNDLTVDVSDLTEGEYLFYAKEVSGICESGLTLVTLKIVSGCNLDAPQADNKTYTLDQSWSLTVSENNPDAIYTWYSESEDGILATGPVIEINDIVAIGEYVYYVTKSETGCTSDSTKVIMTIVEGCNVSAPEADDKTYTLGDEMILSVNDTDGDSYTWYKDGEEFSVGTGNELVVSDITAAGEYTYYVTKTVANCISDSTTVTLKVVEGCNVSAPAADNKTYTLGQPLSLTVSENEPDAIYTWYSESEDGVLATGPVLEISDIVAIGEYVYYVTKSEADCTSDSTKVIMTIVEGCNVSAPVADDKTYTLGEEMTLSVNDTDGDSYTWYKDGEALSVGTGAELVVSDITAAGEYIYYVTKTVANCISDSTTVTLEIVEGCNVSAPAADDKTYTVADEMVLSVSDTDGDSYTWYKEGEELYVGTGAELIVSDITAAGEYTFYVTKTVANCISDSTTVTLEVIEGCDVSAPVASDKTYALGNEMMLSVDDTDGDSYTWYKEGEELSVGTGADLTVSDITVAGEYIYYVTKTVANCISDSTTVTLNVIGGCNVSAPAVADKTVMIPEEIILSVSDTDGDSYTWYKEGEGLSVGTGPELVVNTDNTDAGEYFYYVTKTIGECTSDSTKVQLTVIDDCAGPITPEVEITELSVCENSEYEFTVTSEQPVVWLSSQSVEGDALSTEFSFSPTEEGTYYVYSKLKENCYSDLAVAVTLNFKDIQTFEIESDKQTICSGAVVTFTVPEGGAWIESAGLTEVSNTEFTVAPVDEGAYEYIYETAETETSCSVRDTVEVIVEPGQIVNLSANFDVACQGEEVAISADGIQNGVWATDNGDIADNGNGYATLVVTEGTSANVTYTVGAGSDCVSSDNIMLRFAEKPQTPVVEDVTVKITDQIAVLAISSQVGENSQFTWKSINGEIIGTGAEIELALTETGTFTYTVFESNGSCVSQPATVKLQVDENIIVYTDLETLIGTARTIYSTAVEGLLKGEYNIGSKAVFLAAIEAAEAVVNSADTQAEVTAAINALNEAMANFDAEKVIVDKVALQDAISLATKLYNEVKDSIGVGNGQYPEIAVSDLQSKIADANLVFENIDASQEQIDLAKNALAAAVTAVKNSKIVVDLSELESLLTSAKDLLNTMLNNKGSDVGQYPDGAISVFNTVIETADALSVKENVTSDEVAKAVADLKAAISVAEQSVITQFDLELIALQDAIDDAKVLLAEISELIGDGPGEYPQDAVTVFSSAIDNAVSALTSAKTEEELKQAQSALADAVVAVKNSRKEIIKVSSITAVPSMFIDAGETVQLVFDIAPANASNKEVTISIANPSIAAVDKFTNQITGLTSGKTVITIASNDGGASIDIELVVAGEVAVTEAEKAALTVYPTIAVTEVKLVSGETQIDNLIVSSANGTVLSNGSLQGTALLDVSAFATGLYKVAFVKDGITVKTLCFIKK